MSRSFVSRLWIRADEKGSIVSEDSGSGCSESTANLHDSIRKLPHGPRRS